MEKAKCGLCGRDHGMIDCPQYEDAKAITIARLEAMPSNLRIHIIKNSEDV